MKLCAIPLTILAIIGGSALTSARPFTQNGRALRDATPQLTVSAGDSVALLNVLTFVNDALTELADVASQEPKVEPVMTEDDVMLETTFQPIQVTSQQQLAEPELLQGDPVIFDESGVQVSGPVTALATADPIVPDIGLVLEQEAADISEPAPAPRPVLDEDGNPIVVDGATLVENPLPVFDIVNSQDGQDADLVAETAEISDEAKEADQLPIMQTVTGADLAADTPVVTTTGQHGGDEAGILSGLQLLLSLLGLNARPVTMADPTPNGSVLCLLGLCG